MSSASTKRPGVLASVAHTPDLVVSQSHEAHTCARPASSTGRSHLSRPG